MRNIASCSSEGGSILLNLSPWDTWENLFWLLFVSSFKPKVSTSSADTLRRQVKIVEVGPRDGLQNEKVRMEISQKRFFKQDKFPVVGTAGTDKALHDTLVPPDTEQSPGGRAGTCDSKAI